MSKAKYSARVEDGIDSAVQNYKDEHGLDEDSEAVRQLLRRGIEATDGGRDASSVTLDVTHIGAVVSFLGAVMALLMAIPFGWDVRLLAIAGALGFASLLFSASTVSVFGVGGLLSKRGDTS